MLVVILVVNVLGDVVGIPTLILMVNTIIWTIICWILLALVC